MRNYFNYILVPCKDRVIEENGLPADQMTLFKSDFHYFHKDGEVIKLLKDNNIIPFFTPAKLIDVFQECDVVADKPFLRMPLKLHSLIIRILCLMSTSLPKVKLLPLSIHC